MRRKRNALKSDLHEEEEECLEEKTFMRRKRNALKRRPS